MTAQSIKKVVAHLKKVPEGKFVSIIDYIDFLAEKGENYDLTPAGKELLKRKQELDSGKVKSISLDEAFDI